MFIHIGNNHAIRTESIVTIIDYNLCTSSSVIENLVKAEDQQKKIIKIKQTPKSVVITNDLIYYSSLSVYTLQKRSGFDSMIKRNENYKMET